MVNFYQVLGLRRESGAEEIRGAYREKAKETHPDLGGDGALFLAVKEAYEILRAPKKRIEWESRYRAFWEGKGAVLCLLCFSATRKGGCCRVCGEQSEAEPFGGLRADLLAILGAAATEIGARVGDEIANQTIRQVNRGLSALGRSFARRK
jgi:curved DNA-binding protein CbpA